MENFIRKIKCKWSWVKYNFKNPKWRDKLLFDIGFIIDNKIEPDRDDLKIHLIKIKRNLWELNNIVITIYLEHPGILIGKSGRTIDVFKGELFNLNKCKNIKIILKDFSPLKY